MSDHARIKEPYEVMCAACEAYNVARNVETAEPDNPATRWQPIETAPKDRTPILVASTVRARRLAQCVVFWREELNEWYSLDLQPFPCATHWMPLPAPPSEEPPSSDARILKPEGSQASGSATDRDLRTQIAHLTEERDQWKRRAEDVEGRIGNA